jgi:hypothetical protein
VVAESVIAGEIDFAGFFFVGMVSWQESKWHDHL